MEAQTIKAENNKRYRKPYILNTETSIIDLIANLKKFTMIPLQQIKNLLKISSSILTSQPTVLKLSTDLIIVGDIHGQFYDLLKIFDSFGYPPQKTYLFMGDYVDRGYFCIQVLALLLHLKITYPGHIYLLRGNHEGITMTSSFNFRLECIKKYNLQIYELFLQLFMKLPLCAIVKSKYFVVHGGISPNLNSICNECFILESIQKIDRMVQIKQNSQFLDLLWSDPIDQTLPNWSHNKVRRCSFFFSPIQSQQFLNKNSLKLIIRGHQVTEKGFKYQKKSNQNPLTLTVFSAPNYCDTYNNKAVVAFINDDSVDIKSFHKAIHPFVLNNYMDVFDFTLPLLSKHITSILKILYKIASSKSRRSTVVKNQDNKNLSSIENIQQFFYKNSKKIMDNMMENLIQVQQINQQTKIQQNSSQVQWTTEKILKFLSLKLEDEYQKYPSSFGPKNVQFVKMQKSIQEDQTSIKSGKQLF